MIHYHGTPLTPRSEMLKMAGKHFCVSFANPYDADWCLMHGQSVMWDNGAFKMHTKGKQVDWSNFYDWVAPRLGHPHWAVVPDVIDGDIDDNLSLSYFKQSNQTVEDFFKMYNVEIRERNENETIYTV